MVVVYYALASGILGWTNPIVLQRWNFLANHTGEIHKKHTMSTRHIEINFHSFDSTCTNIIILTLRIFWYFLTKSNYMIMFTCTCSLLFYFKEKHNNSMKNVEGGNQTIKKKIHVLTTQGREGELYFNLESSSSSSSSSSSYISLSPCSSINGSVNDIKIISDLYNVVLYCMHIFICTCIFWLIITINFNTHDCVKRTFPKRAYFYLLIIVLG